LYNADIPIVYFNPKTLEHKRLEPITEADIREAFAQDNLRIFTNSNELRQFILKEAQPNRNVLLMSSGTFDGIDYQEFADEIIRH